MEFLLRSCASEDADALGDIFYRAVHEGAASRYTAEERAAWVSEVPRGAAWAAKLAASDCVVAESGGVLVGFMSRQGAHFDMAYVVPEIKGTGVAGVLCAVLEGRARAAGVTVMSVEASHLAEPFLARRGWQLLRRQVVERRGVRLANCVMEKQLIPDGLRKSA
ncbi:MAG: GNAT family N-acetyltransferase [Silicimonas sp.]|nr:GNAT family N-acetyltransferase [Silicimonas sp.]